VQFSVVDRRPQVNMVNFCQEHDIKLFTYGSLCGGLLSEKYLNKPELKGLEINTTSLRKYKQMIDNWGGWGLLQQLLNTLKTIADKHQVNIANVAVNYILNQPAVGGVIVGARLGIAEHLSDNARVFSFNLDAEDIGKIDAVFQQSKDLYKLIGDCGDEYRS
jgi:aryl-alcohol dehydrogenase-like predicted oxidoreductase